MTILFFFSSRRRHTRWTGDWSSDVCSSDLERRADHRREDEQRDHHQDREGREEPAAVVDHAVRGEQGHRHQRDHPRRVNRGLEQLREIEAQPVDGRRHQQIEVLGEEEAREGRNDVRQDQDRDEREQGEPEHLAGQEGAELFDAAEIAQNHVEDAEHAGPERESDGAEQDQLAAAPFRPLLPDPLEGGPPLGLEDVEQRRLIHLPSTSASSLACAPPVSLRNSSSRLASPAWCCFRMSSTVPSATIFPCWMIAIRSHIVSATSSVWVLMSTVPPRVTNWRKMSLSSRAALGSSPTIGSSTTITAGR